MTRAEMIGNVLADAGYIGKGKNKWIHPSEPYTLTFYPDQKGITCLNEAIQDAVAFVIPTYETKSITMGTKGVLNWKDITYFDLPELIFDSELFRRIYSLFTRKAMKTPYRNEDGILVLDKPQEGLTTKWVTIQESEDCQLTVFLRSDGMITLVAVDPDDSIKEGVIGILSHAHVAPYEEGVSDKCDSGLRALVRGEVIRDASSTVYDLEKEANTPFLTRADLEEKIAAAKN